MDTKTLILSLGGTTAVANLVGCSPQRVNNWIRRGHIPADVKLDHPDLFLTDLKITKPKKSAKSARP